MNTKTAIHNQPEALRNMLQGRLQLTRANDVSPWAVFSAEARRIATLLAIRVILPQTKVLFGTQAFKTAQREGKASEFFANWIEQLPLPVALPSDRVANQVRRQATALAIPAAIAAVGTVGVQHFVAAAQQPMVFAAVGLTAVMTCYAMLKSLANDRKAQLAQARTADNGNAALVRRFAELATDVRFDVETGEAFSVAQYPGRQGVRAENGHLTAALIYKLYCYNTTLYQEFADENLAEFTKLARQMTDEVAAEVAKKKQRKAAARAEHGRQTEQQFAAASARMGLVDFAAEEVHTATVAGTGLQSQYPLVNPATGLPMMEGGTFDVGGNVFGLHD